MALEVNLATGQGKARGEFLEDLLFTHRGLSGPAILQISSYWKPGEPIVIDLAPGRDLAAELLAARSGNWQQLHTVLAGLWPKRLADRWLQLAEQGGKPAWRRCAWPMRRTRPCARWRRTSTSGPWCPAAPPATRRPRSCAAGSIPAAPDQKSMQARATPGLYFIGETVDVTGWLGGYNFRLGPGVACGSLRRSWRFIHAFPARRRGHASCCPPRPVPSHSLTA